MSIEGELASAKGRRDEAPNIALAEKLTRSRDKRAIAELIRLTSKGTKPQRRDAIKALYEVGERAP